MGGGMPHSREEQTSLNQTKAMRSADNDFQLTINNDNGGQQASLNARSDDELSKLKSFLNGDFQANASQQKQNEKRQRQIMDLRTQFGNSPPLPPRQNPGRCSIINENAIKIKVSQDPSPINTRAFRYDRGAMSKSLVEHSNGQSSMVSPLEQQSLMKLNSGFQQFSFQQYNPSNYKSDQTLPQLLNGGTQNTSIIPAPTFNGGKDFFVKPKLLLKSFNEKKISQLALAAAQQQNCIVPIPIENCENKASLQSLGSPSILPLKQQVDLMKPVLLLANAQGGSDQNTPAFTHPHSGHDVAVVHNQAESTFKKVADHNRASIVSGGGERFEEMELEIEDNSVYIGTQRLHALNPSTFQKMKAEVLNSSQNPQVEIVGKPPMINSKIFNFDEATIKGTQTPLESVASSAGNGDSLNTNSFLNSIGSHNAFRTPYIDSMTPSPQKQAPIEQLPIKQQQAVAPVRKSLQIEIPPSPPPKEASNGLILENSLKTKDDKRDRLVSREVIEVKGSRKNSRTTIQSLRQQRQSILIQITDEQEEGKEGGKRKTLRVSEALSSENNHKERQTSLNQRGIQNHRDTMELASSRKLSVDHLAVTPQAQTSHGKPRRSVIVKSDSLEQGGFLTADMIKQHEEVRRQLRKSASPSQLTDGSSSNGKTEPVSSNSKVRKEKSASARSKAHHGEAKISIKFAEFKDPKIGGTESALLTNTLSQQSSFLTNSVKPARTPILPNPNQPRNSKTGISFDPEKIRSSLLSKVAAEEKLRTAQATNFNTNKVNQKRRGSEMTIIKSMFKSSGRLSAKKQGNQASLTSSMVTLPKPESNLTQSSVLKPSPALLSEQRRPSAAISNNSPATNAPQGIIKTVKMIKKVRMVETTVPSESASHPSNRGASDSKRKTLVQLVPYEQMVQEEGDEEEEVPEPPKGQRRYMDYMKKSTESAESKPAYSLGRKKTFKTMIRGVNSKSGAKTGK